MNDSKKIELSINKPYLIYGGPGSGKSFLSNELLKDTILLRIDTNSLKDIKDIKNYILDRLKKRNVTLMFSESNEQRGLLIDDIHVFYKYDKSSYKSVIEFIRDGKYYKSKIILTCCSTFLKNKDLCKLKIPRYHIRYTYSEYYKICLQILKDKKIKFSGDQCDKMIYLSKFNFNSFLSECLIGNETITDTKDNFDPIEDITENLIRKKYSLNEIYRLCENDGVIIALNLLENCLSYIREDGYSEALCKIYEYYTYSDKIEILSLKNHNRLVRNYSSCLSIYVINTIIHDVYRENNSELIYNKYISRSMVNISSRNAYYMNDYPYDKLIIYFCDTYIKTQSEKYKEIIIDLVNRYPKRTNNGLRKYEYFYGNKITLT